MENKIQLIFDKYLELRDENSRLSEKLFNHHKKNVKCKKGCNSCCIDYNIFPVEFYFILDRLCHYEDLIEINSKFSTENNKCVFLIKGICSIYEHRPIICRTHGLPLLFANDDGVWELSVCDLNFTNYDFTNFNFENTFPQDKFNSKLFLLNKEFITVYQEKKYSKFDLIPVKNIYTWLKNKNI